MIQLTATPVQDATDDAHTIGSSIETTLSLVPYDDGSGRAFLHGHAEIGSSSEPLSPGQLYRIVASGDGLATGDEKLEALASPLPANLDEPITIFTASCYDASRDGHGEITSAYQRAFPNQPPTLSLLCGDQVYLDSPWQNFRKVAGTKPRQHYLDKYQHSWGARPGSKAGLHEILQNGPTWFLPDDHEFWNNFPHATPLALYSYTNWKHILKARARRFLSQSKRFAVASSLPSKASDKLDEWERQLYEPTDPCEWDAWGRAAYELFHSFQTPAAALDVSQGAGDPDLAAPPPLSPVVQSFVTGPVHGVLLDTRTKRTRSGQTRTRPNGHSVVGRFVPDHDAAEVIERAGDASADVFVLVLAQPLFTQPTDYESAMGRLKASLDFDRNMEDFQHQYRTFWNDLVRARAGRPTIIVGGDVHDSRVSVAGAINTVEIVASPMALVGSLASWKWAGEQMSNLKTTLLSSIGRAPESGHATPGTIHHLTDLLDGPNGQPIDLACTQLVAHEHDGFGTIEIAAVDRSDGGRGYDVTMTLVPREEQHVPQSVRFGFREDGGRWSTAIAALGPAPYPVD